MHISAPIFSYLWGQEMRLRDQLAALDVAEALLIWIVATNGLDSDRRCGTQALQNACKEAAGLEDPPCHLQSMRKWRAGTHKRGQRRVCSGMGSMAGARMCQRGAGCMGGMLVMAGTWRGLVCERDTGGARGVSVRGMTHRWGL